MTIHWLGIGLSAVPGVRYLIAQGHDVRVWNRSLNKAKAIIGDSAPVSAFDLEALNSATQAGDILVSMLPGAFHVPVAEVSLANNAHFVSSSYISPEMRALDAKAREKGLVLLNEVGLDPGLDHLMAHHLVDAYKQFRAANPTDDHEISFTGYCGGLSEKPNNFCYQFSWSPVGVLKALLSPSRSIQNHQEFIAERPWHAVQEYTVDGESFEVYPNRDSLPFMADYRFDPSWKVKNFIRGSLRYKGWCSAWQDIFCFMENLHQEDNPDQAVENKGAELWQKYPLGEGEHDRVVLSVELKAECAGNTVWHQRYLLDAVGDDEATAMARLVSIPVALMAENVGNNALGAGVQAAPHDPALYAPVLAHIAPFCRIFTHQDLLA